MSRVIVKHDGFPEFPSEAVVRVGILETGDHPPGEGHEGGLTIGELAEIHEFGAGPVPARAPIRVAFDTQQNEIRALALNEFQAAAKTGQFQRAADRVAVKAAAGVRNVISEGLEPISESTARRKEARGYPPPHTPLVETGVLRSAYVGDAEVR